LILPIDKAQNLCYIYLVSKNFNYCVKIFDKERDNMNPMPGRCPVCSSALNVTRLQCPECGTGIDGLFGLGRLQALTPEQLQFVETFMKCRGKIKDVEDELGVSYPTVVSRLNEVVRAMGYEVDESDLSEVDRFEYYQARAINPPVGGQHPTMPVPPTMPTPPRGSKLSPEKRQEILDDLAEGKISAAEAMQRLNS
jgi:hypothetical protein